MLLRCSRISPLIMFTFTSKIGSIYMKVISQRTSPWNWFWKSIEKLMRFFTFDNRFFLQKMVQQWVQTLDACLQQSITASMKKIDMQNTKIQEFTKLKTQYFLLQLVKEVARLKIFLIYSQKQLLGSSIERFENSSTNLHCYKLVTVDDVGMSANITTDNACVCIQD